MLLEISEEAKKMWEELHKAYPEYREEMTEERLSAFVEGCYVAYEKEGFNETFHTRADNMQQHNGKKFTVVKRVTGESDIEAEPAWFIHFEGDAEGITSVAYPEEVILRELLENEVIKL